MSNTSKQLVHNADQCCGNWWKPGPELEVLAATAATGGKKRKRKHKKRLPHKLKCLPTKKKGRPPIGSTETFPAAELQLAPPPPPRADRAPPSDRGSGM